VVAHGAESERGVTSTVDTSGLVGGPIKRYGGKGQNARLIVPHFARASLYAEACFGAGSVFYKLAPGAYEREVVNDLDGAIVTFFRVLRDRPDELVRACALTPYALDEYAAAFAPVADDLERARRVWILGRQSFAGKARGPGNWGRDPSDAWNWNPRQTERKLRRLYDYAARLRGVVVDHLDAADFVRHWGHADAFVYVDLPYLPETRKGPAYDHEADTAVHRRVAGAAHEAVARGARVGVSGYAHPLYDEELYAGWRRVTYDVPLHGARDAKGQRRTECLWLSYGPEHELQYRAPARQPSLFGGTP
jgi:DNA adenine methylase